jgi:hypothetical protein
MALNHPQMHEGYAPAYQVSATPFVTSSNVTLGTTKYIDFGYVSRFITIKNTSPSTSVLSIAFTENGLKSQNSNYFFLSGSEAFSGELRATGLYLSGSAGTSNFSIVAGLTAISSKNSLTLTGSNGFTGVG